MTKAVGRKVTWNENSGGDFCLENHDVSFILHVQLFVCVCVYFQDFSQ